MADAAGHLDQVGAIVGELGKIGLDPILVGGMALVSLGSRRVTRDFDFVIPDPGDRRDAMLDILYGRGLELASRLDAAGDVSATISSKKVASIRMRLDAPATAYFFSRKSGLRIDLLFDFPLTAESLRQEATAIKIRSHVFRVASEKDLLRLKQIALEKRKVASDASDIAFLEGRLRE